MNGYGIRKNDLTLIEEDQIIEAIIKSVICIIGITGNSINLFVLTRNKINITAIYLIAISTVDILRLGSAISNTLEYFQWIHLGYDIYWKFRPILSCITFSTQAMSLLLIVSFSINRYIIITNPYKKFFLNKKLVNQCIIVSIVIISFTARIPITINIVSGEYVDYDEMTNKFCKLNSSKITNGNNLNVIENNIDYNDTNYTKITEFVVPNNTIITLTNVSNLIYNDNFNSLLLRNDIRHCKKVFYYTSTIRSHNHPPSWYRLMIATVFGSIPMLVLIIINIKIILILKESSERRSVLTNSVILHQNVQSGSQKTPLITKENRTILHLIIIKAVIALLRLPYFIFMYFLDLLRNHDSTLRFILQLSSYSLDINASLNFFLFCILPENYRKQFFDTMSRCCKCCNFKNNIKIRNKKAQQLQTNPKNNRNNSEIINTAFISDNLNRISIVSEYPGDQPHQPQQSQQHQQENKHHKLEELCSYTSSSSDRTSCNSQTSQASETSII